MNCVATPLSLTPVFVTVNHTLVNGGEDVEVRFINFEDQTPSRKAVNKNVAYFFHCNGDYVGDPPDDVDLTRRVARAMAHELASVGINVNYAPVADIATRPGNPSLGVRSFGEDPTLVGAHVAAAVEGYLLVGILRMDYALDYRDYRKADVTTKVGGSSSATSECAV